MICSTGAPDEPDFEDIEGQEHAKRGLDVAAAGSHNVLMIGPPGPGKTMLAQCLSEILYRSASTRRWRPSGFKNEVWRPSSSDALFPGSEFRMTFRFGLSCRERVCGNIIVLPVIMER